ncbi:MAG: TIGR03842 family LLM class F420-dependent oxidoreductase [Ardenticatenaceae bacterium]|nr:TIGR03842 family LLM class F420-dependent oxidoreductase [Ardenticatenaceae bacterium]HBY94599.1 TIGR03842 family LLM class F420-dependent oxidoreductase [Chloroflexota bacterium]
MDFAITLKLDMPVERAVGLMTRAEEVGFTYGWVFDSHVLWMEPWPMLTLFAANTRQMHFGPCVTNPVVRDPTVTASLLATLNRISGGRMELGIGRGDSSRRVLGKKPTTLQNLEQAIHLIRELTAGHEAEYDGQPIEMPWATAGVPRIWVAGYGPKALDTIGRVADGVILQFADPQLIEWCLGHVRRAAEAAGRDFSTIRVMSAAPALVTDDIQRARDNSRWFGGMVGNHVADLVQRYDDLPPALVDYIRGREGYDYRRHAEIGSDHTAFVPDDVVDRFCVLGTPEQVKARLQHLREIGVHQFNIYLMAGDEEETLERFGADIIPSFRSDTVSA